MSMSPAQQIAYETTFKSLLAKFHKQPNNPNSTKIERILSHLAFCVTTLQTLRSSLSNATKAFHSHTKTLLKRLQERAELIKEDPNNPHESLVSIKNMVSTWFINYVRLLDAKVLLVSGEARHPGDVNRSKQNLPEHKSRLNKQGKQGDGYTTKYKGDYYTGAAWDDIYDEVGIKAMLKPLMSENKVAKLMEDESEVGLILTSHENAMSDINDIIEKARRMFEDAVSVNLIKGQNVSGNMKLNYKSDKQESLEINLTNSRKKGENLTLWIKREGDKYVILDERGVLPIVDEDEWVEVFGFADVVMCGEVKKRRIIDDDDDDDDDDDAMEESSEQEKQQQQHSGMNLQSEISTSKSKPKPMPILNIHPNVNVVAPLPPPPSEPLNPPPVQPAKEEEVEENGEEEEEDSSDLGWGDCLLDLKPGHPSFPPPITEEAYEGEYPDFEDHDFGTDCQSIEDDDLY